MERRRDRMARRRDPPRRMSLGAALALVMLSVLLAAGPAAAHAPSAISVEYDIETEYVMVYITHTVSDPNSHYIHKITIEVNGELSRSEEFTRQTATSELEYSFYQEAEDGDVIKVTAFCNQGGDITGQVTVVIPDEEPDGGDGTGADEPVVTDGGDEDGGDNVTDGGDEGNVTDGGDGMVDGGDGTADGGEGDADGSDGEDGGDGPADGGDGEPAGAPKMDGKVGSDEYDFSASFGKGAFELSWSVVGERIYMAMVGETEGWVSIGFGTDTQMKDADMVFGWVTDSGGTTILDSYSEDVNGPHDRDTNLGGTYDILGFGGAEKDGRTTIEFNRLLDTNDKYDHEIPEKGKVDVIWAIGSDDDDATQHFDTGYGRINLETGESESDDVTELWPAHALLMVLGYLFMVLGAAVAKMRRNKKTWFKNHRALGALGSVLAIAGLVMGIVMVAEGGGTHMRVPHSWLGAVTIAFCVVTPIMGYKRHKFHRKFGSATQWLMLINIISGFLVIFLPEWFG